MNCAWDAFIHLLPNRFRTEVGRLGKDSLQEVRLRLGQPPQLVLRKQSITLQSNVTFEDLQHCVNFASRYSPWSASTVAQGYITAPGGHRVGIFGRFSCPNGQDWTLQSPAMLCLRAARDFPGIAAKATDFEDSVLIIGRPGCGKTTLLRDLIRQYSDRYGRNISVIDEREEIFPRYQNQLCFPAGRCTDILSGCKKQLGIEWALRNMTPSVIAVDEITAPEDCQALLHAGWCGVTLFATAHAGSKEDLFARPIYKPIISSKIFKTLLIMQPDKGWRVERINI